VIGQPFNDGACRGSISQVDAELVTGADPLISEVVREHATTESPAAWIRSLPQRDDNGADKDCASTKALGLLVFALSGSVPNAWRPNSIDDRLLVPPTRR
jgi:hypothetical protein